MVKRLLALTAVLGLLGASRTPVSVSLHVQRTSFDLLDVLAIQVTAHNPSIESTALHFTTPQRSNGMNSQKMDRVPGRDATR